MTGGIIAVNEVHLVMQNTIGKAFYWGELQLKKKKKKKNS